MPDLPANDRAATGSSAHAAPALRIVVMGTGPFAVPMFERLLASRHRIVALVTRPDRAPAGRRAPGRGG